MENIRFEGHSLLQGSHGFPKQGKGQVPWEAHRVEQREVSEWLVNGNHGGQGQATTYLSLRVPAQLSKLYWVF